MGSPAQHKKKTGEFLAAARKGSRIAGDQAKQSACLDSLMRLLESRMNLGSATAESHWWDYQPEKMAEAFREHTDATLKFERACLRAK